TVWRGRQRQVLAGRLSPPRSHHRRRALWFGALLRRDHQRRAGDTFGFSCGPGAERLVDRRRSVVPRPTGRSEHRPGELTQPGSDPRERRRGKRARPVANTSAEIRPVDDLGGGTYLRFDDRAAPRLRAGVVVLLPILAIQPVRPSP